MSASAATRSRPSSDFRRLADGSSPARRYLFGSAVETTRSARPLGPRLSSTPICLRRSTGDRSAFEEPAPCFNVSLPARLPADDLAIFEAKPLRHFRLPCLAPPLLLAKCPQNCRLEGRRSPSSHPA